MKEAFGFDAALLLEEEFLRKRADILADKSIYSDHNRVGKYLKYRSTDWQRMKLLVPKEKLSETKETVRYTQEALGSTYGVLLYRLRSAAGRPLGFLAAAIDMSGTVAARTRFGIVQLLMTTFGIVLLAGVVLLVLRGFLLRPLGALEAGFARLAAGEKPHEEVDTQGFCTELQALGRHLEALRQRGEP